VDVLGTNSMNVTSHIDKWLLNSDGVRMLFHGRNREQKDIAHDDHLHPDIETLHENGEHAVPVGDKSFDQFVGENPYAFVNFYAPWCVWCQRLEPTWEAFAEELEVLQGTNDEIPVDVAKVDCVANRELCTKQKVQAFPTLRLFKDGKQTGADYKGDRTVGALTAYLKQKMDLEVKMKDWHPKRRLRMQEADEHPGCMVSGYVLVNRVPGNFHLEARSSAHNLNAAMTNLSHIVHHLSIGAPLSKNDQRHVDRFPDYETAPPMDGRSFVNAESHQAHHHYLKIVSTHYTRGSKTVLGYQMLAMSQNMHYGEMDVPEAKFAYDLSPMAIAVSKKSRRWYDFVTNVCGIIGGTFTVIGLVDALLHKVLKGKKQL